VVPRTSLGDPRRLAPPSVGVVAGELWRSVAAAVASLTGIEPAKLGFARTDRLQLKALTKRFEPLGAALECFGIKDVELYVSESRTGVARAIAGEQPIVCLGADVASAATPAARFLLGRAMTGCIDGIGVASELRDEELLLFFVAALRVAEAPPLRDGPIAEMAAMAQQNDPRGLDERTRLLGKAMSRRDRKTLAGLVGRAGEITDPRMWRRAAMAFANRAGLLFAGDLAATLEVLDVGRGGRSLVDSPLGLDALAWAVGDTHLGLRRQLGFATRGIR
jgi:hypothetical protein